MRGDLAVARAVAWRSLQHAFKNPALLIPSIIFPLIFLVAFAGGLSAVRNVPGFHFHGTTRRSSSCSSSCSRPRSAGCSPASASRPTSSPGSRGGCCSRRRIARACCSATHLRA